MVYLNRALSQQTVDQVPAKVFVLSFLATVCRSC